MEIQYAKLIGWIENITELTKAIQVISTYIEKDSSYIIKITFIPQGTRNSTLLEASSDLAGGRE